MIISNRIYLDNAATTRPCPQSIEAFNEACALDWGNPSSGHGIGIHARSLLEKSRKIVAEAMGADRLYFTSGGTESNNLAIMSAAMLYGRRKKHIVSTTLEHPSVSEALKALSAQNFEVTKVPPRRDGRIYAGDVLAALRHDTFLISCMLVSNETGAVLPIREISQGRCNDILLHTDAVQGFLQLEFTMASLGADMITVSGHKIHAPKGIGALAVRKDIRVKPLFYGGGQENGVRPGTESVPLAAALGRAVSIASPREASAAANALKEYALGSFKGVDGIVIIEPHDAPHIITLSCPGCPGEVLQRLLSDMGIYVSTGAACAGRKRSAALESMKLPPKILDSALRISFSRENTTEDIDALICALLQIIPRLAFR